MEAAAGDEGDLDAGARGGDERVAVRVRHVPPAVEERAIDVHREQADHGRWKGRKGRTGRTDRTFVPFHPIQPLPPIQPILPTAWPASTYMQSRQFSSRRAPALA